MSKNVTDADSEIDRHLIEELRQGTLSCPQHVALLFALFVLWSHSPLRSALGQPLQASEIAAIGIGFSVFLAFFHFTPRSRRENDSPSLVDILFGLVGMAAFVRLAVMNVPSRVEVSDFEMFDTAIALVGMGLLLEATRRNLGAKIALPLAAAIALLFLGPDLPDIPGTDDLSLVAAAHRLWVSADGLMGLQMLIWSGLILPAVILGTLLDRYAPVSAFQHQVLSPLRIVASNQIGQQSPTWFCGHIFSWCLGISIFFQIMYIGTLDDLSVWSTLSLMVIIPAVLLSTIAVVLHRTLTRYAQTPSQPLRGIWLQISKVLTSVYSVGVVVLCGLAFHSVIIVASRYVHVSGLRVGNSWLAIIVFAVLAAVVSLALRRRTDQSEPSAWSRLAPTLIVLLAFVWFVAIARHSPSLSSVLSVSTFLLLRVLEGLFRKDLPDVARSFGHGLIDAIRVAVPGTLIVAVAGLIVGAIKLIGTT